MDVVRKLILDKLAEKGLTMSAASLKIGRNHAYLQQFLKRGDPIELGEKSRIPLAALLGVPEDQLRGPSSKLPKRDYVKVNSAGSESLIAERSPAPTLPSDEQNPSAASLGSIGERDLQVFGTEQTGSGILIVTKRAVGWVARSERLLRVRDGYAIIVTGDALAPVHKSGSTALVNPHLPPKEGETCVFRRRVDEETDEVIFAELKRFNDQTWYVEQWKPKKKSFSLKRSDWRCSVTVGNYFRI